MNILITGYQGFIGKNMVESFTKSGFNLLYFDWGDKLPDVRKMDWVVHLGAITSTTERDVDRVMIQNYDFSTWLIDECVNHKVNIQYSSSASVYGLGDCFKENAVPDPRTPYAWSKYLVERHATKHINLKCKNLIQGFRYFNVYGPHEDHKDNQASPFHRFPLQLEKEGYITVFEGSDNYKRDFIHVDSVINIHKRFFNINRNGIWNIGSGNPISFLDVAKKFTSNIKTIPMPEILKTSYQKYTCADLNRLNYTLAQEQK